MALPGIKSKTSPDRDRPVSGYIGNALKPFDVADQSARAFLFLYKVMGETLPDGNI